MSGISSSPPVSTSSAARNVVSAVQVADYTITGAQAAYIQLGTVAPSITIATGSRLAIRTAGFCSDGGGGDFTLRLSIDSGATLVTLGRTTFGLSGGIPLTTEAIVAGLASGAHTVKVEYIKTSTGTLNLRGGTQPTLERLGIVLEELPA